MLAFKSVRLNFCWHRSTRTSILLRLSRRQFCLKVAAHSLCMMHFSRPSIRLSIFMSSSQFCIIHCIVVLFSSLLFFSSAQMTSHLCASWYNTAYERAQALEAGKPPPPPSKEDRPPKKEIQGMHESFCTVRIDQKQIIATMIARY